MLYHIYLYYYFIYLQNFPCTSIYILICYNYLLFFHCKSLCRAVHPPPASIGLLRLKTRGRKHPKDKRVQHAVKVGPTARARGHIVKRRVILKGCTHTHSTLATQSVFRMEHLYKITNATSATATGGPREGGSVQCSTT